MKSSTGMHYPALDQIRALAAFMVFAWHFMHGPYGDPVPFEGVPSIFVFAILDEGHTGVALFMTLSGYLFARLLENRKVHYGRFLLNRALRLLPLLVVVILVVGLQNWLGGADMRSYWLAILAGLYLPTLPNGGWSITTEFHFYLLLPLLLWWMRKEKWLLALVVVAGILLRTYLHGRNGTVQAIAYFTIVGRMDQFVLGMLACSCRHWLARRRVLVPALIVGFLFFYWYFDRSGGFFQRPSYPSPGRLWIVLPTIEGLVYAAGIAWYELGFGNAQPGRIRRVIGQFGKYSYSIYLLHFFFVFRAASLINEHLMDISDHFISMMWALVCFGLMIMPAWLSWTLIESPFLKFRRPYLK